MVNVGVVVRRAVEDLDADGAFFERVGIALERLLDDIAEKRRVAAAVAKQRVVQDARQFGADRLPVFLAAGCPCRVLDGQFTGFIGSWHGLGWKQGL